MDSVLSIQVVRDLVSSLGPVLAAIVLVFAVALAGLIFYAKKRLESIAEEISDRSLLLFNKRMELLFRDEEIRSTYKSYLAQKILDKNVEFFHKVSGIYFKWQKSWFFNADTPPDRWQELRDEIWEMRNEIFKNTVLLGGNTSFI